MNLGRRPQAAGPNLASARGFVGARSERDCDRAETVRSGCGAVVILAHAAEALAALNRARRSSNLLARVDELVLKPLMVALGVVVSQILADGVPQGTFAEEDHPVQALFLDRAHEPLQMGVQVRRARREQCRLDAGLLQLGLILGGELRVAIQQQIARAVQKAVFAVGEIAGNLLDPGIIGTGRDAG